MPFNSQQLLTFFDAFGIDFSLNKKLDHLILNEFYSNFTLISITNQLNFDAVQ